MSIIILIFMKPTKNMSLSHVHLCDIHPFFIQEEDGVDVENMEEDVDGDMADIEALNYDDLDNVSKLQKTQRFAEIMQVC